MTDRVEGCSFRASRLGAYGCFSCLGSGVVAKFDFVLRCLARQTVSREFPLGRRVSLSLGDYLCF